MDKKILIGGGVVVVLIVGFVVIKMRNAPNDEEQASGVMQMDTGYLSALAPSSGGMTSGNYGSGGGQMPIDAGSLGSLDGGLSSGSAGNAGNGGATDFAGGFDIMSLFSSMFKGQQANDTLAITTSADVNRYSIATGGYNFDSAVLAGIVGTDGTATVKHENGNTVVTNTPGADPYQQIINNLYQTNLKRDPDLAGSVYWKNALMNNSISITGINQWMRESAEYRAINTPKQVVTAPANAPPAETGYLQSTTVTTVENVDGQQAVVTTARRT